MTDFSGRLLSSDLDAYRSDGIIQTSSLTFSGTLGASSSQTQTSTGIIVPNLDFYQLLYDNSVVSSGKWRDMNLENRTYVAETTFASNLVAILRTNISNGTLTVTGVVLNQYSSNVALQTTTLNLRFVAYDSTLL